MSASVLSAKISGHEAYAWIKNCLENHSLLPEDEEQLRDFIISHKPKDFKNPRKHRVSNKSSSERSSEPKDETKCDAIIWLKDGKVGYPGQCSRKKKGDNTLCAFHQKEADNHCGCTRFGLFDVTRYTHAYNNPEDTLHAWHDVEIPDKPKKEKKPSDAPKGTRKCGICGETGHNKRKCPHRPKEPEDTGAGTGLNLIPSHQEFNQARVNLSDAISGNSNTESHNDTTESQNDTTESQNDTTDSQETVLLVPQSQAEDLDEDLSLDQQDNTDDDDDDNSTVMYQGIQYILDTEDNTIVGDEMDVIGNWDPDTQTIEWINSDISKFHRLAVFELKAKNASKQE